MTIIKTKSLVETYRAKASSKDINELTGRTGRPDITNFIIEQIILKIQPLTNTILVDVGCGDGLLLLKSADNGVDSFKGRLIGILPTVEEVSRVRNHLLFKSNTKQHLISIELGLAEKINLPNSYCDILVCNGVLQGGGQTLEIIKLSLSEFYRVTKVGGKIFIGEMPDSNEMNGKDYGDSITSWLLWVLKNQGYKSFWTRLKQTLPSILGSEPFIISPKNIFYMPPDEFISLLDQYGFSIVEYYKHEEIDIEGRIIQSRTRWNYIATKR